MKPIRIAFLAALLLVTALPTARTLACETACAACPEMAITFQSVRVTTLVGDATSLGIRTLATGLKQGAHLVGKLPAATRQQVTAHSPQIRSTVRTVADRASNTLQQLSVEVTSLSLQLLRNVFSSFWGLVSGLLLS